VSPDWFEYCFIYMRSLLIVESFHFRPSNQYILVRVIPSCFRFAKMCLCQVSLLSRCRRGRSGVDVPENQVREMLR
jgi:hypothetical protein